MIYARQFRDAAGYKVDILGSRLRGYEFSLPDGDLLADLKIKLSRKKEKNASTRHLQRSFRAISRLTHFSTHDSLIFKICQQIHRFRRGKSSRPSGGQMSTL